MTQTFSQFGSYGVKEKLVDREGGGDKNKNSHKAINLCMDTCMYTTRQGTHETFKTELM